MRCTNYDSAYYETILNIISKQQLKLLTALARIGGKAPMSSEFLKNSGITQASSVRRALGRLIDLKILFHHENEYRLVFFFQIIKFFI
jgi:predicted transcriptional regulator